MRTEKENLLLKSLKVFLNISLFLSILTSLLITISTIVSVFSHRWERTVSNLMALLLVLTLAAITVVIYELRCIIKTIIAAKPFTDKNIKRFHTISISILIIAIFTLINNILQYGANCVYILHLDESGLSSRPGVIIMFFLAALSFVLGEVFKNAVNIEEDNKLTI